jgi:histone deacetylase 11
MLEELACIAGFIGGLVDREWWPPLWWVSLITFVVSPFLIEGIMVLKGYCCRHKVKLASSSEHKGFQDYVPIVYSTRYNIHAFGLEKLHPFDASKYRRVFDELVSSGTIDPKTMKLHSPSVPTREFLQFVMSNTYLLKLNFTIAVCKAVELPLPLPGWLLRMRLLEPMQCATLGSVEAACMARIHGWAINLGGGFHHATHSSGGGFCIYPDITFITRYMEEWHGINRFMIVDLDAH